MLRNYFKTALRNLIRNKTYSFINITGLAIGMAVALLIGLWIWDELSFDHYHANHARLAQVRDTRFGGGQPVTDMSVDVPLATVLRTRYSNDFKHMALTTGFGQENLTAGETRIVRAGMWVQPELPEMLSLNMQKGSRDGLKDPSSILLTASLARTLFGNADPMNRTIRVDSQWEVKVAGVFEDLPANTLFHRSNFFLSWDKYVDTHSWMKNTQAQWGNHFGVLFVEIADHADFDQLSAKIKDIPGEFLKQGSKEELQLHPMDRWHLYNEFKNGQSAGGRIQFVWLFGIIGVFVLLLACINFMNLSTARSEKRAKEVGIRKSIGSVRGQLIGQFLCESVAVAFLALIGALLLAQALLPFFNSLASKELSILWDMPLFWLLIVGFTLFTGLISGSYPAFYLSAFDPIQVLKGTFRVGRYASVPRKILVVVQFTVSITLAIGSIIVYRQIQFARDRPVGYSREGLLSVFITNSPGVKSHYESLRNDIMRTGAVENMTSSSGSQTNIWSDEAGFDWIGKTPGTDPYFGTVAITHDYGKTIGWTVVEGRDVSRDLRTDSGAFILNEAAVRQTGFKHPIGQIMKYHGADHRIIGVVKDMVMESPYDPAEPTVFFIDYNWNNYITFRVRRDLSMREAIARIAPLFKKYDAENTFSFTPTDDVYSQKFAGEERIGNLAAFFTILALFISCLGLFGLASFVAEQRTKEIGLRKVLGATVFNLWNLLSKDFVVLVLISCVIAIPLASYYLDLWLQKYAYHTRISWWIYVSAGLGALIITMLTVSYQTIRAANRNPAKSLRTE